ncbi:hypothetical protein CCACVL1_03569 [Corchorus capsularis]|uniref:Uncharacterized protein n=1 Tax=Corchorus capsularis TaxID=210143 RepID=A0A1R3JYG0_COCAP|nr:hypothetical protein CCACVL1_03569 [Corchorus capsularis]
MEVLKVNGVRWQLRCGGMTVARFPVRKKGDQSGG